MQATQRYISFGKLIALTQVGPNRLRTLLAQLKIAPVLEIDGVKHFDEAAVQAVFDAKSGKPAAATR